MRLSRLLKDFLSSLFFKNIKGILNNSANQVSAVRCSTSFKMQILNGRNARGGRQKRMESLLKIIDFDSRHAITPKVISPRVFNTFSMKRILMICVFY